MTKRLILLRHAKSDWYRGVPDHERPLNERGRDDAPRLGRWLAAHGYFPPTVLCSTATRARETLDGVVTGAGLEAIAASYLDELYHAEAGTILAAASEALAETEAVMVVGHNPGMDEALIRLCGGGVALQDGKLMTTASCAVLEVARPDLASPSLLAFVRPRDLPAQAV